MDSQNRRCTSWRDGVGTEYLALDFPRTIRFGNKFVKRGYLIVPFHQRRYRAEPSHGLAIEPPHRSWHRMIMRIDQQVSLAAVTCQMDLPYPLRRNSHEIFHRREAVVDCADVNVVYVQQNTAIGFL